MSLRFRVLAGVVLVAVALGVVMVVITIRTRANLLSQVDRQLAGAVDPVRGVDFGLERRPGHGPGPPSDAPGPTGSDQGRAGSGEPKPGGPDQPRRLSALFVGYVNGDTVETLVLPDVRGDDAPVPTVSARRAVRAAETGDGFAVGSAGSDVRYRARAYVDGRSRDVIVIALPIDSVDNAIAGLVTVEVLGAFAILATLGLVAFSVVHLGIRPVKRMSSVATAIAGGTLSERVPDGNPRTEAGQLGAALNKMLGRIEIAFDDRARADARLRQFVADASHELRTPIATIRGYSEIYRTGGLDQASALDDAIRRTEQEAVRMGGLVDDLLQLARLDQGRPHASEPVDLCVIVDDAARDARAVDPDREVVTEHDGPVVATGDEAPLRQVVANVVGNALVHTPPGSPVELRAFVATEPP